MKYRLLTGLFVLLVVMMTAPALFGQVTIYEGPTDPAGDPAAEREVKLDGNRFLINLNSSGFTGHWGFLDGTKWPANSAEGLEMYDDCRILVGSTVYLKNDSIPVTDPMEVLALRASEELDSLISIEAPTHEHSETSPNGRATWTFTPVYGYFNELGETPAISIDPNSWPAAGWPSRGFDTKWPGEWNGRFGRGVQYAQMESYVVINDAQDQEFVQPGQPLKYFPRRIYNNDGSIADEVLIGDVRPTVTTAKGAPWGGLGIRIEMRGYQWDNPQTRDAVFWEYNISNISEYDLPKVVFGYYMDMGIGHFVETSDGEDDVGYFSKELNLSFCWDLTGYGTSNYEVGALGFAFLESPGIPDDGIDNDSDGLIDEKRDNKATAFIGPTDGITDLALFLEAYGIESVSDLKSHWDADEDQDWRDGNDKNGNGVYESGEEAGDDIGLDGVGPEDLNYYGPDTDGTECNHKPDLLYGEGCEPNFGLLDITESDMLGLQTFHLFRHPQKDPPQVMHDRECYRMIADNVLQETPFTTPSNLYQAFGTGPFQLNKTRTERISMATIAAFENEAVMLDELEAPIIFERKKVVQTIYESDYRFARPPEMPTLKAVAGDGKVTLIWDDRADRLTREPLASGENDFEGYKLYKATDRAFDDALKLRDAFGNPAGLLPIRQWDLANEYMGHTNYALVEGEGYYLGNNSGIQHYYVDTDVDNGRTYYYFLAAYDHGLREKDIAPSENVPTIKIDENEIVTFISPNVQIVTPHTPAAGYVEPEAEILHNPDAIAGPAETFNVTISEPDQVLQNHVYQVTFDTNQIRSNNKTTDEGLRGEHIVNDGFKIFDMTADSLVYYEDPDHFIQAHVTKYDTGLGYNNNLTYNLLRTNKLIETDIFNGIQVSFVLPLPATGIAGVDSINSGWVTGGGPMDISYYNDNLSYYPYELDLVFTEESELYTSRLTMPTYSNTGTGRIIGRDQLLLGESFPFYVIDRVNRNEQGENIMLDIVAVDMDSSGDFSLQADDLVVGHIRSEARFWVSTLFSFNFRGIPEQVMPGPGSVFRILFHAPFTAADTLMFRVPEVNLTATPTEEENLDEITVVPNPYVVTNLIEPAVRNNNLNQRRRIMFTNLPSRCNIKIFTMSGYLVDEIQVSNTVDYGIAYWDVLSKEDLEVAAGVYLYYVKSENSGKEKLGKFAIIK
ncbi:hypothetical protein JW948_16555 [bacterium]|nr:hypothetical protein [bacterium]